MEGSKCARIYVDTVVTRGFMYACLFTKSPVSLLFGWAQEHYCLLSATVVSVAKIHFQGRRCAWVSSEIFAEPSGAAECQLISVVSFSMFTAQSAHTDYVGQIPVPIR